MADTRGFAGGYGRPFSTGMGMIGRVDTYYSAYRSLAGRLFAALLVSFLASGAARADASLDGAASYIQTFGDRSIALLSDDEIKPADRRQGFRDLISAYFDLSGISRFVLGRHWRRATADERDEYQELFEAYVVGSVDRKLSSYAGETLTIEKARPKGEGGAVVTSRILRPEGNPVRVEWRLRYREDAWQIIDMVVEGVSLALTQRNEFDAVIKQGGGQISSLLRKLREQTAGKNSTES